MSRATVINFKKQQNKSKAQPKLFTVKTKGGLLGSMALQIVCCSSGEALDIALKLNKGARCGSSKFEGALNVPSLLPSLNEATFVN